MPISHDKRRSALVGLTARIAPDTRRRLDGLSDLEAERRASADPDAPPSTGAQLAQAIAARRGRLTSNSDDTTRTAVGGFFARLFGG